MNNCGIEYETRKCFNCGRDYKTGKDKEISCYVMDPLPWIGGIIPAGYEEIPVKNVADEKGILALCPDCTRIAMYAAAKGAGSERYVKDLVVEYEE